MPTARHHRRSWLLPLAALALGCSSTGELTRRGNDPDIQTIAAIGDRPLVTKSGSGSGSRSSAVADFEAPRTARSRDDRVSGRVVDADGEPVPGATVRVADGGLAGGRVAEAISDRAGGFTLHGLRPGSSYQIIAEYEEKGGWVEGRAEAHVPSTGIEIAVRSDGPPADRRRAGRTPAGRTISDRIDAERDGTSSRVNEDDLPDDRDDRDPGDDQADARPARKGPAVMVAGAGWHASRPSRKPVGEPAKDPSALGDRATLRASTHPIEEGDDPLPHARRRVEVEDDPPPSADGDDENPLPPAIEPGRRRSRGDVIDEAVDRPTATRPRASRRVSDARPQRPGLPPGALSSATHEIEPDPAPEPRPRPPAREPDPEPAPAVEADALPPVRPVPTPSPARQDEAPAETAKAPAIVTAPTEAPAPPSPELVVVPASPSPSAGSTAEAVTYDPFPPPKKPATWADLSDAWEDQAAPSSRSLPDVGPADPGPQTPPEPVHRTAAIADRPRAPRRGSGPTVETCRYDARRLQIVDFRLPDLDGRPVSLGDLDADFILLDFWGTWCRPCLMSVPHLVEIQKRFQGRSVAVLGIACEEGPASASAAHVADVARQLGINYTVLVSSKDDSASPLQEALHVSAFPTMILIDRNGRIVWRDQGATTATLARLDRILATSTRPTETARR